jgi:DNA polymerase III epsilon subunit-like protein
MNPTTIFVFDFETTGLPPKNIQLNKQNFERFPRAVQACCLLYNTKTQLVEDQINEIILLDDTVIISEGAFNVHNISMELSKEKGVDMENILKKFFTLLKKADCVIGHNIEFDSMILKTEIFHHFGNKPKFLKRFFSLIQEKMINHGFCTMRNTIDLCALERPSFNGGTFFKFPKLMELHEKLFGTIPENLHDANTDCHVCLKCYLEIKKTDWENQTHEQEESLT